MAEKNSRKLIHAIEGLLRRQAALASFGTYAFRETDLQKILEEAARLCAECLGVPYCKICKFRPETNDLLIIAGHGWKSMVVGLVVSAADESTPQGRSFVTGQPVIIENVRDATLTLPPFYGEHGIISTVDVLIHGTGGPYGVLEIDSPIRHIYDHHDVDFLTGFANVLAEAVETSVRTDVLRLSIEKMRELVLDKDRLLDEKKVMVTELHHRVRNNLQLVYGMITNKLEESDRNNQDTETMRSIARRVMTLAKVYDHLLGSRMDRSIDFGAYLKSLCDSLEDLQDPTVAIIGLSCDCASVILDLDTVTALGIVVAELVSNSYHHAFAGAAGQIKVSLLYQPGDAVAKLGIDDNGVGFDDKASSDRHGLKLIQRLVEQVQGTVALNSDHGTHWNIGLPVGNGARGGTNLKPALV
jgi:two-component sensor histidine kinase